MVMCHWVQNRMPAYLSGELGARPAKWLLWHLGQCRICQRAIRALKGMQGIVTRALPTDSRAPDSLAPRVMAVSATHDATARLWQMGQPASLGLQKIAEEGDRSQALTDLAPMVGGSILDLESPLTSPLPPLGSFSVTVGADAAHPLLSAMWMLGRTNDGFAGLDSIDLAAAAGTSIDVVGLDAGTENNNEKAAYMAALGGHLRDPENGVIHLHPGILGIADAPIAWNWTNPVARIQVARASAVPEPGALSLLVVGLLPLIRYRRRQAA